MGRSAHPAPKDYSIRIALQAACATSKLLAAAVRQPNLPAPTNLKAGFAQVTSRAPAWASGLRQCPSASARVAAPRGRAPAAVVAAWGRARAAALPRGRAAVVPAAVVAQLLLHHLVHEALGVHAASVVDLGARRVAENQQPLLAPTVQRHEHEGVRLLLHAPQLAAPVACDPTLAILRDVHLGAVVTLGRVGNSDAALALV
mmetsp:Transcript_26744/g.74708  ORF Transcript_26744/g.74708 Transcript_26744/m.74708 type:complete len:202 (+) Transcript_26744:68-673(+)